MLQVSITKRINNFVIRSSFTAGNEIFGILGPSGCGKSATLQCIAGLVTPDEGTIILNDKILFDSRQGINIAPRFRNIGYVFQHYALFPHLTVNQNIAYGIHHIEKKRRKQLVSDMIDKMHLGGLHDRYPHQLSGGQQQRVALARTLITEPELLLLDEPFSAVDNHVKQFLEQELLQIIQHSYSGTVLFVTHNIEEAYRLCKRIMIYSNGEIVQNGVKEEIIHRPANLTAAQITGCKNLLPFDTSTVEGEHLIIHSRGLKFHISNSVTYSNDVSIIGFRAHHVRLSQTPLPDENTFPCEIINSNEGIFSATLQAQSGGHIIQAEVPIEEWNKWLSAGIRTGYLQIPVEHIFLVSKDR